MNTQNKKTKMGGRKTLAYSIILATMLVIGFIAPVNAVELNTILGTTDSAAKPSFQFVRTYIVEYPNGGEIKNMLDGKNVSMTLHMDQFASIKKSIVKNLNSEIIGNLKSAANITDVDITYEATLYPSDTESRIDYKVTFIPTVSNYVLRKATGDSAAILDTQWRGLTVQYPILVDVQNYGQFDINSPASFIKKQFPDLYSKLQGTNAQNLFEIPLMSSNDLMSDPISKWQHLFDPAYTIVDTNVLGYQGQKIVISTYATGESNISEGTMFPTVKNSDMKLDVDYPVSYTERSSTASIQIDGYVAVADINGIEYFGSSPQAPTGSGINSTGNYSAQVIYSMAAFAVVIAVGIFWWSSRVSKNARNRQNEPAGPSGPIQYETRKHWADRFDDEK
ncbi:MAG: hypothetical protein KGI10_09975 [Thaumarchaeota archaeon]|nr:hypothetical protein [Nitrososphaerota archaeon]